MMLPTLLFFSQFLGYKRSINIGQELQQVVAAAVANLYSDFECIGIRTLMLVNSDTNPLVQG